MSVMTGNSIYESGSEDRGSGGKLCLEVYEDSGQFIYMPKMESDLEETAADVSDDAFDDKGGIAEEKFFGQSYGRASSHTSFYQEEPIMDDGRQESLLSSNPCPYAKNDDETGDIDDSAEFEDDQIVERCVGDDVYEGGEEPDSDEETIATFLTAAGQRLALYAVEDSDQVFAVAVYDESGEPPTNFQFLMKSDVERLIGEGAVRTVKKPTQLKKQHVIEERPSFAHHSEPLFAQSRSNECRLEYRSNDLPSDGVRSTRMETGEIRNDAASERLVDLEFGISVDEAASQEREATGSPSNSFRESSSPLHNLTERAEPYVEDISDVEILQRSTVDHLLMDDETSDEELTFADIEESMTNFRRFEKAKLPAEISEETSLLQSLDDSIETRVSIEPHENGATIDDRLGSPAEISPRKESLTVPTVNSSGKSPARRTNTARKNHATSSLIRRRDNSVKQRAVSRGSSLLLENEERMKNPTCGTDLGPQIITMSPKAKRPRKQQLTSVNRGDSEIIIQPATFPDQEDEDDDEDFGGKGTRRKKIRRKRKSVVRSVRYRVKASVAKRLEKRRGRRSSSRKIAAEPPKKPYEIIEIDVDEKDRAGAKEKNIVEITIDESNKENEVIMVGDSDDEAEMTNLKNASSAVNAPASSSANVAANRPKCENCLRTFRQKRALRTHSRVCPKSARNIQRLEKEKSRANESSKPKKQYACKICQETFDVVVVLARHVKAMHSLRKKNNSTDETQAPTIDRENDKIVESTKNDEASSEITTTTTTTTTTRAVRRKRGRRKITKNGWKGQKLTCSDCNRWFSSAALLASHSLQHATRKSEKQLRRCQTCKKIIKTRLLYIRHMRMHSRAKKLQKKLHHTRQATVKLATLRKRARPRKS